MHLNYERLPKSIVIVRLAHRWMALWLGDYVKIEIRACRGKSAFGAHFDPSLDIIKHCA
ncbi:hypothetical protein [Sulfurirhabdus autotrophica]|uniref:hypothetical protein n=1 Tax=Sulfurirhabdus autotrophica TaxID=1706046 RepID=UPI001405592C|nr:hypothetical protein [Sulfurirhabdus autotrophica]